MLRLVTWKGANREWGKFHWTADEGITVCGKRIPPEVAWHGPLYQPIEQRHKKHDDICVTCATRGAHHLRVLPTEPS